MKRFSKLTRFFVLISLLGFGSVIADVHLDEYSSKKTAQQTESCCVSCCPAHHLGPTVHQMTIEPVRTVVEHPAVEIFFHSQELIVSVFHPPRFA